MIIIVDCGIGNSGSVLNMIKKVGGQACISSSLTDIANADALILPGVGAFDNGMEKLNESGIRPALEQRVLTDKTPFLGICLGMQLLFNSSEEGTSEGLGWIDGHVTKFKFDDSKNTKLKIPHMGWNEISIRTESDLFKSSQDKPRYYFVHSYHVNCDKEYITAEVTYGYPFTCAINKDNIYAAQFHPEKSHKFGMEFFKNFIEMVKC